MDNCSKYTLFDYKRNQHSFWADIPHHLSQPIIKKNKHIKRKNTLCRDVCRKRNKISEVSLSTSIGQKQRKAIDKFEHKHDQGRYLYHSKCDACERNDLMNNTDELFRHNKRNIVKESVCGNNIEASVGGHTCRELVSDNRFIQLKTIPLYIHFQNNHTLFYFDVKSFDNLVGEICNLLSIPSLNLMIFYDGKMLERQILKLPMPYDSIHAIVKGKGGMQSESTLTLSQQSDSEQVISWLLQTVQIEKEDFIKYPGLNYLDGEALLKHTTDNVISFKNFLNTSVGIARKILIYLEKEKFFDILKMEEAEWKEESVEAFVKSNLKPSEIVDKVCVFIKENRIDGKVFLSYRDGEDMKKDFPTELQIGSLFHQIIKKRNELLLSKQKNSQPNSIRNKNDEYPLSASLGSVLDQNQLVKKTNRSNPFNEDDFIRFVEEKTCLRKCKQASNDLFCKLQIIHSNWKNANDLEKRMLFLVLSNDSDYETKESCNGLWNKIRNNMPLWRKTCSPNFKESFKDTSSDAAYYYTKTKQSIRLTEPPVHMRYLADKKIEELKTFENVFLLISDDLLQSDDVIFKFHLKKPVGPNPNAPYYFSIDKRVRFWQFCPSDYSEGFSTTPLPGCKDTIFDEKNIVKGEDDSSQSNVHAAIQMKESDKNSELDIKTVLTHLEEGGSVNKQPTIPVDNVNIIRNANVNISYQQPRPFRGSDMVVHYTSNNVMATPEHDGAVGRRCFEFKYYASSDLKKESTAIAKFLIETLKFACGCLNARRDGTIMFGVADNVGKVDEDKSFQHGEIVGFILPSLEFKQKVTEALIKAKELCFEPRNAMVVKDCISNPVFISVATKDYSQSKFVMEVDIEPVSYRCKNDYFLVDRSKIPNINAKQIEKSFTLFVREGSSTPVKNKIEQQLFVETKLKENIKERESTEQLALNQRILSLEQPMDKLRILLCKGTDKLDKSIWPILAISKPSEVQRHQEEWIKSMRFLKKIHFHAVFDFDDFSNISGMSRHYRNEETSALYTNDMFQDYAGRQTELEEKLGFPLDMKTIWIFANGRHDMHQPMGHLDRLSWLENYSTGIWDAVTFFSNIISNRRALIIFLLFSDDFDGVIETFNQCTARFGWKQVLIISCEDEHLRLFKERIVFEKKGTDENVNMCSVSGSGTTWEHVCATFLEVTYQDDDMCTSLPTVSGALIEVEQNVLGAMSDLQILSAKQCEGKVKPDSFRNALETDFYKGGKVRWYNFFFQDHVLQRHCLSQLCSMVDSLFTSYERTSRKVAVVTIAHEPGAGGTTLAHNVLWNYRKKYRCAIITKLTNRTAQNIQTLWKYKEKCRPKPILLLIDELSQSEFSYQDLIWKINKEILFTDNQSGLICCLIVCQKETDVSKHCHSPLQSFPEINKYIIPLCQKLTDDETAWMENKFKQIENRNPGGHPEHLISFMILRNGFNENYITQTIAQCLQLLDVKSNEVELLKYASLVSAFVSTSVRGSNAFIPVECCDELLGRCFKKGQYWEIWEKNVSHYLNIFLKFDQKECASGKEIRMSHPALALPVLKRLLVVSSLNLSQLTLQFLGSSLFTCSAYGKNILEQLTKEMLTRRLKEEYNDSKNTYYSPLIEQILSDEDWHNAASVLEEGINKFKDCYMCQTLARLYSWKKQHDAAVAWSRKAEHYISSPMEKGSWHHNLGTVLRENFQYQRGMLKNKITTEKSQTMLKIILEAIQHFVEAREHLGKSSEIRLLYTSQDVIKAINICAEFIHEIVEFAADVDVKKLLTDSDYMPVELSNEWKTFKPRFLQFLKYADESFDCIESYLCYYTIFYEHDPNTLHRFHNQLHHSFPKTREQFSKYLGEENEKMPESASPELVNIWHRRRLINLMGNNYMNMYDILAQVIKENITLDVAINKCLQIKHHLQGISTRQPKDLLNLVAVNFLLGVLKGRNRDSLKIMFDYCMDIIKTKRGSITQAHFFISILLWPCDNMELEYNDEQFYSSLMYLNKNMQKKIERNRGITNTNLVLKEERNITKPTAQFFLTSEPGIHKVCHRFEIFNLSKPDADAEFDKKGMWEKGKVRNLLKRLKGQIRNKDGSTYVVLKNPISGKEIQITKIRGGNDISSETEVYFYLGFSIAGLLAYNVRQKRLEDHNYGFDVDDKFESFLKEPCYILKKKLQHIQDIRSKLQSNQKIEESEKALLEDEEDIRRALAVNSDDSPF